MWKNYFKLKYGNRIDNILSNNPIDTQQIPINKNYIITELKKEGLNYQDCVDSFNNKYPKYKDYHKLYYNEQRALFFSDPEKLIKWFDNQKNSCGYCGITQEKLKKLAKLRGKNGIPNLTLNGKIKRSKGTLEIEKKDPNKGYTSDEQCILACPLCNNAKSNLIDEENWKDLFVEPMKKYYKKTIRQVLNKNLYITYSNQKTRDLKRQNILKPLSKVITLDNLILELFESNNLR